MATLNIELSTATQQLLDREIASGRFPDPSALIEAAVENLLIHRWPDDVGRKIDEALDDVERGDVLPWKPGECAEWGKEYLASKRTLKTKTK